MCLGEADLKILPRGSPLVMFSVLFTREKPLFRFQDRGDFDFVNGDSRLLLHSNDAV